MRVSVFVPEALVHLISTRSPACSCLAAILAASSDDTVHVTAATVTVPAPIVSAPCASIVSGLDDADLQPPRVRTTASPPDVPPPSLPPVKPPADVQFADTLAISLFHGALP